MEKKQLLTSQELDVILHRLACQLIENHTDFSDTVLIGLQPRGVFLAQRLVAMLRQEYQVAGIQYGALDITFFRDDFRRGEKPLAANTTDIPFLVEDKKVVFIDDVLYTGRTVRAAMDAILDVSRPQVIRLAIMVDRGHRELPIRADFIGKNIPTAHEENVHVCLQEVDGTEEILLTLDLTF